MDEAETIHPPPGAGIPGLRYISCINATSNFSPAFCANDTSDNDEHQKSLILTQEIVRIVVPLLFGIIVFVGLIGNALVSNGQEQSFVSCLLLTGPRQHFLRRLSKELHVNPTSNCVLIASTVKIIHTDYEQIISNHFSVLLINLFHCNSYPNRLVTNYKQLLLHIAH
jgi:hypothetical protein